MGMLLVTHVHKLIVKLSLFRGQNVEIPLWHLCLNIIAATVLAEGSDIRNDERSVETPQEGAILLILR